MEKLPDPVSMGSAEKFCLRWNDFEANVSTSFAELRHDQDFFDVTLALEDHRQVRAHKVILAACSPFFRRVLKANPHERPLLYLKGVRHAQIVSVLNFMYHGEVNVAQDDLNDFLAAAEDLSIKGLTTGKQEASLNASRHQYRHQQQQRPRQKVSRPPTAGSCGPVAKKARSSEPTASQSQRLHPQDGNSEEVVPTEEVNIKDEPRGGTFAEGMMVQDEGGEEEDMGMEGEVTAEGDEDFGTGGDDDFEAYEGFEEDNREYDAGGGQESAAGPSRDGGNKGMLLCLKILSRPHILTLQLHHPPFLKFLKNIG